MTKPDVKTIFFSGIEDDGPQPEQTLDSVIQDLLSSDRSRFMRAAMYLITYQSAEVVDKLLEAEKKQPCHWVVGKTLAQMHHPEVTQRILATLKTNDLEGRRSLIALLRDNPNPQFTEALTRIAADGVEDVRSRCMALFALEKHPAARSSASLIQTLIELMRDRQTPDNLRAAAGDFLTKVDIPTARKSIMEIITDEDEDDDLCTSIAESLCEDDAVKDEKKILQIFTNEERSRLLRLRMGKALYYTPLDSTSYQKVLSILNNKKEDVEVRCEAASIVSDQKRAKTGILRKILLDKSEHTLLRARIASDLQHSPENMQLLMRILDDRTESAEISASCAEALNSYHELPPDISRRLDHIKRQVN